MPVASRCRFAYMFSVPFYIGCCVSVACLQLANVWPLSCQQIDYSFSSACLRLGWRLPLVGLSLTSLACLTPASSVFFSLPFACIGASLQDRAGLIHTTHGSHYQRLGVSFSCDSHQRPAHATGVSDQSSLRGGGGLRLYLLPLPSPLPLLLPSLPLQYLPPSHPPSLSSSPALPLLPARPGRRGCY